MSWRGPFCDVPKASQTNDVVFRNIGDKTIPSGTPVTWFVKASGQGGQFVLTADLPVGKELTAADLLSSASRQTLAATRSWRNGPRVAPAKVGHPSAS